MRYEYCYFNLIVNLKKHLREINIQIDDNIKGINDDYNISKVCVKYQGII